MRRQAIMDKQQQSPICMQWRMAAVFWGMVG
jgi:hypothetical protein